MKRLERVGLVVLLCCAVAAQAEQWVEVGVDTDAKYFVDLDSIEVEGETVRLHKRGDYTHPLTDSFGGQPLQFKGTLGMVELDCGRRIHRVTRIDMIGLDGEVVWSSGPMSKRLWEDVRPASHGEATLDFACEQVRLRN